MPMLVDRVPNIMDVLCGDLRLDPLAYWVFENVDHLLLLDREPVDVFERSVHELGHFVVQAREVSHDFLLLVVMLSVENIVEKPVPNE